MCVCAKTNRMGMGAGKDLIKTGSVVNSFVMNVGNGQ